MKKKRPTSSAQLFKNDGAASPTMLPPKTTQPNTTLQNLVTAHHPTAEIPVTDLSATPAVRPVDVSMEGMERVRSVPLPKAPPIIDNSLGNSPMRDPFAPSIDVPEENVVEVLPQFPTQILGKQLVNGNEKKERTVWPVPQIKDLPQGATPEALVKELKRLLQRSKLEDIIDPERNHSDYAPSGAERTVMCQASAFLSYVRGTGDKKTKWSEEGDLAHEIAAPFVDTRFEGNPYPYEKFLHSKYTKEMFNCAEAWADYCYRACEQYLPYPHSWAVEERVCIDAGRDIWGTLDFGFVANVEGKLYVVVCDYKYGKGVDVDSENEQTGWKNWQLALYALGLISRFVEIEKNKIIAPIAVTAHVFQPRVDEAVPPVTFSLEELLTKYLPTYTEAVDLSESFIVASQEAIENGEQFDQTAIEQYQNVGKWCQFCKGQTLCKSYADRTGVPKAKEVFSKAVSEGLIVRGEKQVVRKLYDRGILSAEDLGYYALNASAMIKMLEEFAPAVIDLLNAGEHIPYVELDETTGKRSWIDDQEKVVAGLKALGIEQPLRVTEKLMSITDVEAEIGKEQLDALTQKSEGGVKIVRAGMAKRPVETGKGHMAKLFQAHLANGED